MKKLLLTILSAIIFFSSASFVSANINNSDETEIVNQMNILMKAVNQSDTEKIQNLLSPNASETLKAQIQNIRGQNIKYQQNIGDIEKLSTNKIRISGKFAAQGINWNISGDSNYFIFEKVDGNWYLLESNFAQKLSTEYVMKFIGKIFIFVGPIFLLIFAFWIWMIVDISKRPLQNKTKWLLIVVLLNWLGAILYFFIARRKHIISLKQEQNKSFPEDIG